MRVIPMGSDEDVEVAVRETNGNVVIETPPSETGHETSYDGSTPDKTYFTRDVAEQVHEQLGDLLEQGDS